VLSRSSGGVSLAVMPTRWLTVNIFVCTVISLLSDAADLHHSSSVTLTQSL